MEPLDQGDPRHVGPYRILARIGTGGMAVVYLGRSRGGRAVAVKVVHAELAREVRFRERFRHEVAVTRAAAGMHSPPVLGADTEATTPWMASGFVPSVPLRDAVERFGPLPAGAVLLLAAALAEALAALHRTGIVHLDVTPANVLLTADSPRLVDFGIAAVGTPAVRGPRSPQQAPGTGPYAGPGPAHEPVTGGGGSWGFMSPEQVAGAPGPPSDIHSLGSTLAYALHGTAPADGTDRTDRTDGADGADGTDGTPRPGPGPDGLLRELITACRHPDPAARPTAAGLTERLAPAVRDARRAGTAPLPPAVLASVAEQAGRAENPPPPRAPAPHAPTEPTEPTAPLPPAAPAAPASPAAPAAPAAPAVASPATRRRLLRWAAGAGAAAAGAGAAVFALTSGDPPENTAKPGPGTTGTAPGTSPSPAPSPSPSSPAPAASDSGEPVTLEFSVTGDGPLTSLTYYVDGTPTKHHDLPLPWHRTLHPTAAPTSDWRLRLTFASGSITWRVRVNGRTVQEKKEPSLPVVSYPYGVDTSGSLTASP